MASSKAKSSSTGGVTAKGKATSKRHAAEDRTQLTRRIAVEKTQQKIDARHSRDHLSSLKASKATEAKLKAQKSKKGKGSSGGS